MKELKNKKFLVVDDEELILQVLRDQFELFGVIVTTATNGLEAFELIKKQDFDLVISDIRMPECSGIELLDLIRNHSQKVPDVILISAFQDISVEKAKNLGAKGLFLKPDIMQNIIEAIKNTI